MFSTFFIIVVIGAIVIPFVLGPLVVRFTFKMPARPQFTPTTPESMPSDALLFFKHNTEELEKLGFVLVSDRIMTGFLKNLTSYIRLLINRSAGDAAMCAYTESKVGQNKKINRYVEFCTEFSSNREITTNNSSLQGSFKPVPEKKVLQFPRISDVHELYQIHSRETANFDRFAKKVLPPEGNEFEHLSSSMNRDLERQARLGYLYFESLSNTYRPTWKGAFMMTWKSIVKGKKR